MRKTTRTGIRGTSTFALSGAPIAEDFCITNQEFYNGGTVPTVVAAPTAIPKFARAKAAASVTVAQVLASIKATTDTAFGGLSAAAKALLVAGDITLDKSHAGQV